MKVCLTRLLPNGKRLENGRPETGLCRDNQEQGYCDDRQNALEQHCTEPAPGKKHQKLKKTLPVCVAAQRAALKLRKLNPMSTREERRLE